MSTVLKIQKYSKKAQLMAHFCWIIDRKQERERERERERAEGKERNDAFA